MNHLSPEDYGRLQEKLHRFPGFFVVQRILRQYNYHVAANVLGDIREVNARDIENDNYYRPGDYTGDLGIEKSYEKWLRGVKGKEILVRDATGKIKTRYNDGADDVAPVAGNNLKLSIDIGLQAYGEMLMQGKVGAIVCIEPKTGEILALASSPTWDPQQLVGKARSANYTMLQQDETKPLYNRATQATYPPGSTFKTIQALVCLQQRAITPNTLYPCSGPQSKPIKCTHHHGSPVALDEAIEQSCNPYFWCAFRDLLQKDGYGDDNRAFLRRYDLWRDAVMAFGLGQRFADTDLSEQSAGAIPSIQLYNRIYGDKGWKAITVRSLSIGQGEILVTPLQLANQAAAIANEGYFITPHLNRNDSMLTHRHSLEINAKHFAVVKEGMHRVMKNGTGRWYQINGIESAGKTGTAQNPHGKDHAIFIGFAPVENPQIAVAVVVENAGFGATWAAPVASLLMEQYLTGTVHRNGLKKKISESVLNESVKKW